MITIGPITIMSTKQRNAFQELTNRAYALHQIIWYADDLALQAPAIRDADAELSTAISHVPPPDVPA